MPTPLQKIEAELLRVYHRGDHDETLAVLNDTNAFCSYIKSRIGITTPNALTPKAPPPKLTGVA